MSEKIHQPNHSTASASYEVIAYLLTHHAAAVEQTLTLPNSQTPLATAVKEVYQDHPELYVYLWPTHKRGLPITEKKLQTTRSPLAILYDHGFTTIDRLGKAITSRIETEKSLNILAIWRKLRLHHQQELLHSLVSHPEVYKPLRLSLLSLAMKWELKPVREIMALPGLTIELKTALLLLSAQTPEHFLVTCAELDIHWLRDNEAFDNYANPGALCQNLNLTWENLVLNPSTPYSQLRDLLFRVHPEWEKLWWSKERDILLQPRYTYQIHNTPKGKILHLTATQLPHDTYTLKIEASSWQEEENEAPIVEHFRITNGNLDLYVPLRNDNNTLPLPEGELTMMLLRDLYVIKTFRLTSPYGVGHASLTRHMKDRTEILPQLIINSDGDDEDERATAVLPQLVIDESESTAT